MAQPNSGAEFSYKIANFQKTNTLLLRFPVFALFLARNFILKLSFGEVFMKHRNVIMTVGIVLIVSLLGSCDALFTNVFKEAGLGQVSAASLQGADAATLIAESGLDQGMISESFVDAVIGDDATKAAVVGELETAANDPKADPATVQAAEALIVEIEIKDVGADQILDNIAGAATVIGEDFNIEDTDDFNALVDAIVPQAVQDDPEQLAAMIDALDRLSDNFELLADNVKDNGGEYAAGGIDTRTLAQTAAIVAVISALEPKDPSQTIGQAVAAALANPDNVGNLIQADTDTLDNLSEDPTLTTLFSAAGIDLAGFLDSFDTNNNGE